MNKYALFLTLASVCSCNNKETDSATQDTDTDDSGTDDSGGVQVHDPTASFESPAGCADFLFFDRNASNTSLLELRGQGLAESAHATGGALTVTHDFRELPEDIQLVVRSGTNLDYELCNDALDPNVEVTVDDSFIPVNGTLTLTVTPTGESTGIGDFPAELEVQVQMADFCADIGNGETHHENCFSVSNYSAKADIGWLPG